MTLTVKGRGVSAPNNHHIETKRWGFEVWIENNDEYCGKRLVFTRNGGKTSMHFHVVKRETMYCQKGSFTIHYIDTETGRTSFVTLYEGQSVEIPRMVPHCIEATEDGSELIEFSTQHFNEDSLRLTEPR